MSPAYSDEDLPLIIKALDHYNSYLVASRREDNRYKELLDRLQRKGPGKQGVCDVEVGITQHAGPPSSPQSVR
jgi:hypothetical protein